LVPFARESKEFPDSMAQIKKSPSHHRSRNLQEYEAGAWIDISVGGLLKGTKECGYLQTAQEQKTGVHRERGVFKSLHGSPRAKKGVAISFNEKKPRKLHKNLIYLLFALRSRCQCNRYQSISL
jgi:hypothetical protein